MMPKVKIDHESVARQQVKLQIERALRERFPADTIDVSDGFEDNIHVVVHALLTV